MPNKIRMHVVHASSEDDSHKAQELNTHSPLTKGWQSGRFCLYPQDLILKLEGRTRIRKIQLLSHHYLISSKVEFFVGDVPEGLDDLIENARYTRLGYVALSENEKTGYRARELKSVHVDAVGTYLKLVLHKNYINRHNLYNQIGIVAINLIGTLVSKGGEPNDEENANPEKTNPNEAVLDQYLQAYFNRPDYVSPLDDLAFDMYQDPEIANIIRKLERKKQEAVINEKFDEAKKIRDAISRLQRVGEKLGRYEVEKRQAIEQEDYERAALKKQQTSEYRHSVYRELNLEELLGTHLAFPPSGQAPHQQLHLPRTSRVDDVKLTDKLAARETERDRERTERERDRTERERELRRKERELREREANLYKPQPAPASFDNDSVPFDERPLPAIARGYPRPDDSRPTSRPAYGLASEDGKPRNEDPGEEPIQEEPEEEEEAEAEDEEDADADADGGGGAPGADGQPGEEDPNELNARALREAGAAVDVFGQPLVAKAYSKTWSFREDALVSLYKMLSELPSDQSEQARDMLRASAVLVARGVRDKVFAVFRAATNLERFILTEFVPKYKIPRSEVQAMVERTLASLLNKTGDTAVRNRDAAKQFIIEMAVMPEVSSLNIIPHEVTRPLRVNTLPAFVLSRLDILEELHKRLGTDSGLSVDSILKFCAIALEHHDGKVRERAHRFVVALYKQYPEKVRAHLPEDNENTRRRPLYRQLFEELDKLDGRSGGGKASKERERVQEREMQALQAKLNERRTQSRNRKQGGGSVQPTPRGKAPGRQTRTGRSPPAATQRSTRTPAPPSKQSRSQQRGARPVSPAETVRARPNLDEPDALAAALGSDKMCIFCGEQDEGFTEEGLDLHYWKACPMLKRCNNCKQLVEIAMYSDHLLTECEAKDQYAACPVCGEALAKGELDQHMVESGHEAPRSEEVHCPLCHKNIQASAANIEEAWRNHLTAGDPVGCKQNPRRLLALTRTQQGMKTTGSKKK